MIKLVALDLDDTLLTPDGLVSPESRRVLHKLKERGVFVTIATGRMYSSAVQIARDLGLDVPLITYQGALIKTTESGAVLRSLHMPADLAREVLLFFESKPVHINLYIDDELVVSELNEVAENYAYHVKVPVRAVGRLSQQPLDNTVKIVAIGDAGYIASELLPASLDRFGTDLTVNTSRPHFLEIGHRLARKSCALKFLGEGLGITRQQMMAIGDGQNDIDMIEFAGIGVAMGNADGEVISIADFVTRSNSEDGVAYAIDELVLKGMGE